MAKAKKSDPRNNADDAFKEFMAMSLAQWSDLNGSLLNDGVLQPEEMKGYRRAVEERGVIHLKPNKPNKKSRTPHDQGIADTALAVTKKVDGNALTFEAALDGGKQLVADGLQLITATVAMRDLTDVQVRDIFDYTAGLKDAVDETKELTRARILDLALRAGEPTGTGNSSRKLTFPDGKTLFCKVQKTGTDPTKFEASLRAKGKDVAKYMAQVVSYKMSSDYDSAQKAIDDGVFTADEVAQMAYKVSYAVERSKEGKGE